jgi:hypothetical protein
MPGRSSQQARFDTVKRTVTTIGILGRTERKEAAKIGTLQKTSVQRQTAVSIHFGESSARKHWRTLLIMVPGDEPETWKRYSIRVKSQIY